MGNANGKQMMSKYFPKEPHPDTGEPFVKGMINTDSNNQLIEFYERAPMPPTREFFDDEGYEVVRSDEEMQTLRDNYKVAHAEWVKRGSPVGPTMHVLAGVPSTTGEFWTDSGAWARGALLPDGSWRWLEARPA